MEFQFILVRSACSRFPHFTLIFSSWALALWTSGFYQIEAALRNPVYPVATIRGVSLPKPIPCNTSSDWLLIQSWGRETYWRWCSCRDRSDREEGVDLRCRKERPDDPSGMAVRKRARSRISPEASGSMTGLQSWVAIKGMEPIWEGKRWRIGFGTVKFERLTDL